RDMLLQHRDLLPDHRSVAIGHSPYQPDPALGKLEHLQRARIKNQLFNVLAHELFGTYAKVHREGVLREKRICFHVVGSADSGDLGWRMVQSKCDLAGYQVRFVAVGQCDDDIGVAGSGALQHVRVGSVADDSADIQPVLQLAQHIGTGIHHRHFIRLFARQVVGRGGADLAGSQYEDLHYSWGLLIFICTAGPGPSERAWQCTKEPGAILHEIQVGIAQHQPLGTGMLEVHLDPRVRALAFAVQDYAVAKFLVVHPLSQSQSQLRGWSNPAGRAAP